jgi:hypothetical protein
MVQEIPDGMTLVDDRPPLCPNGCGLLEPIQHREMECNDCGYVRKVLEFDTLLEN